MEKLTEDQAIKLYGKVPLLFENYYKYVFTYVGEAPDGATVLVAFGGEAGDAYGVSVSRDDPIYLDEGYNAVEIKKDGETLYEKEEWSEYA